MWLKRETKTGGLNILIVGGGKVGRTLVEQLSKEGNSVKLIDKNKAVLDQVSARYDIMTFAGNGASHLVLEEAGIDKTDLLIAVTDSDELNLLCCLLAKQFSDCAVVARVRTPDYQKEIGYIRSNLGLTMVFNPDYEAAKEASRILSIPQALEVNSFASGRAEMIKIKIPPHSRLAGKKIADLDDSLTRDIVYCVVERGSEVFIPSGTSVLCEGDVLSFASKRKRARKFLHDIGMPENLVKKVMIVGGGRTSLYLASRLINNGMEVRIIEINPKRADELKLLLPQAQIICGDGTDEDQLQEYGLDQMDAFVALTGIDEENILLTMHARSHSKAKTITKINRTSFREVINSLDIGSVINPRYITSEAIIAYARAKKNSIGSDIETLYHLFDHRVEAIEFVVKEESKVTGIALKDLNLKQHLLIAFMLRDGHILFPSGQDEIRAGDSVMIVTTHSGLKSLTDILAY